VNFYKSLFLFCSLTIVTNTSFAQFDASIWTGVNSSSFGGNPPKNANYESTYGLTVGADLSYHLTEEVVLALEPTFNQMGSKIVFGNENNLLDSTVTYTVKQNYFGIGLLFQINTKRFYVGTGINYQILTSAELEHQSSITDIKEKFLNYDVVSFFSVGYKIPIGAPYLFIDLRYLQGLVNIYSDDREDNTAIYIANFKSTGLKLSMGITFPL